MTGTFWFQFNHPSPATVSAENQAVGQEVSCGNKGVSGPTRSHPAACCLRPTPLSAEALPELRMEGAKRGMMLPMTHVLMFGEYQRLCGLPESNMRRPDTPQRCYTAVSLVGAWLVAQSEATPSEYEEKADAGFGHIPGPLPISQGPSSAPQKKLALVRGGAWSHLQAHCRAVGTGDTCLSGSISLPVQAAPQSPSS